MTDPTRPVRDQDAEAVRSFEPSEYEGSPNMQARWRCSVADAVLALPVIADALSAAAERDALRATVAAARMTLARMHNVATAPHPGTCSACWVLADLDGATQAAPRPAACTTCGSTGDQAHAVKPHADAGIWPEDDAPAAQGVPLTEDRPFAEWLLEHTQGHAPHPSCPACQVAGLTEDPQR